MKTSRRNRQRKVSTAAPPPAEKEWPSPLVFGIIAIALVAGVFAIYSPALNFQFILDDHRFVGDPRVQSPGHIWEYFTSYVWAQIRGGPLSFYRPVFVLWMRLNFLLNEMSSWGWHLFSIAKHVLVAVLLGLLVWKLLRDRVAALIAATLFALHPAQTESVAWVTVPDPLMAAGVLGTLLLHLRYAERAMALQATDGDQDPSGVRPSGLPPGFCPARRAEARQPGRAAPPGLSTEGWPDGPSPMWLIASAAACLAAMMAKETAIVLPVVLFATFLMMPLGEGARLGTRLASAFRQTLPYLVVTAVYLLLRFHALGGQINSLTQHLPWSTLLLSCPATLWFYGKVLLWPVQPHAFADPTLADRFSVRGVLLPGLGVLCALAILLWACVRAYRRARRDLPDREAANVERALLLGMLLLVLPILLTLNLNALNPGDLLHGRYTYLPLTGLMLLLATGWHRVKKGRTVLSVAVALVAVTFSVLAVRQEGAWKDDLTVFTVAHQYAPHNEFVAKNLVMAHVQIALRGLDEGGRCDDSVPIFEQAIQQYPQEWFAWAGLGECLVKLNDLPRAEQSLRRASDLSHEPRVTEAWQQVRARMGLSCGAAPCAAQ